MAEKKSPSKKQFRGKVVSDKMDKTVVVQVDRLIKHPLYKKYIIRSKNYKAHDSENKAKNGDLVSIVETRPMSKDKRWAVSKILRESNEVTLAGANK